MNNAREDAAEVALLTVKGGNVGLGAAGGGGAMQMGQMGVGRGQQGMVGVVGR